METIEEWRESPTLPSCEVSSLGRFRVIPYYSSMPNGGTRKYGGKEHSGVIGDGGRPQVFYKGKTYRLHKLICEAFHGSRPYEEAVVMHLDEDCQNNCSENLAWGTKKENLNAPGFIAYCKSRTGDNSPVIKGRK